MDFKNCKPLLPLIALYVAGAVMLMIVESNEEAERLQQVEEIVLQVSDKPYIHAEEAQTVADELQEEQEAVEEYYEPVYGNSYWYESDDAEAEAAAKEWIAWRESGGDYNSRNGQYVGKFQLNEMYLDGDYSEENQEAAAEAYIADRYGSWQAAQEHWREHGWY